MRRDVADAVLGMYRRISAARERQEETGAQDRGNRKGMTSGRHLDPLARLIRDDLVRGGFNPDEIRTGGHGMVLPGWFRASKDWDILAFDEGRIIAAIELKSINSSFGNNLNNRVEEALGAALDAGHAAAELLFGGELTPPILGYVLIVRDSPASRSVVGRGPAPAFPLDGIFEGTSYRDRFRIMCERMAKKQVYGAVWLVFADPDSGTVTEPSPELSYGKFIAAVIGRLGVNRA